MGLGFATAALAALVILAGSVYAYDYYSDEKIRREVDSRGHALKRELDVRFPAGAPQADVTAFLRARSAGFHAEDANG